MSPEQMLGERLDGRADVFSLAAVAYEMLTGRAPFPGETVTEVVSRVVRGAHVPPRQADPRLPEAMDAVFARYFTPKPENRLARATELARELSAAAAPALDLEAGHVRGSPPERAPSLPDATVFMAPQSMSPREALLLLECDPAGDAVVDGRPMGRTPLALELSFGRHEVHLVAAGREPVTEIVELQAERPFQVMGVTLPTAVATRAGELVAFGPGVVPPRRIGGSLPVYPEAARAAGLEGVVEVEIRIDGRGRVRSLGLRRSAGAPLDEAMLRAVAGWSFAPATARGAPVEVRLLARHLFRR
jgi:TonB family protein